MEDATCDQAKRAALRVACDPELNGIVYLSGGLVPWLLTGADSGRLHGDVDVTMELADLDRVRAWAQRNGFWREEGIRGRFPATGTAPITGSRRTSKACASR